MKTFIKLSILFLAIFSLICCEKDIEIETSFPFASEVFGETKSLQSNTLTTTLQVNPERLIKSTEYFFSYDSSGKGFYTVRGVVLAENQNFKLNNDLREELVYTPNVPGIHTVNFDFVDSNGNSSESQIEYEITGGDEVEFEVSSQNNEINVSDTLLLMASINIEENSIVAQDLEFNLSIESSDNSSRFEIRGVFYSPGDTIFDVDPSDFLVRYSPGIAGEHVISFRLEDVTNGDLHLQEIPVTVKNTEFDFSFVPTISEIELGMPVQIALDITQTSSENLSYDIDISGQQGLLTDDSTGTQRLPLLINNVSAGSRNLVFTPQSVGTNDFVINITASNGMSKTERFSFTTKPLSFDFEVNPPIIQLRNGGIGVGVALSESISIQINRPQILSANINYSMRVLSEIGSFTIRNINGTHTPGSLIQLPENTTIRNNVVTGQFEFPRTLQSSGNITIVVANSTGFEVRKTIAVEVITE